MRATNYLEVVGLLLIGFALDRVINHDGNTTVQLAIDLGLEQHWNDNRFWFVALTCIAVALTLVVFQNFEQEESEADSLSQVWTDFKREFFALGHNKLVGALHGLAFSLQIIIPLIVTVLFSPRVGASLFIGFVLVDAAIFIERYLQKRSSA